MLDRCDHQSQIILCTRQLHFVHAAKLNLQACSFCHLYGALVDIDPLESPPSIAEVSQQTQMKPVTAANVQYPRIIGQATTPTQEPLLLESRSDFIGKAKLFL